MRLYGIRIFVDDLEAARLYEESLARGESQISRGGAITCAACPAARPRRGAGGGAG